MNKRSILGMVAVMSLTVSTLAPAGSDVGAAASRTFPETGKTVSDPFLSYWDGNGGLAQQGYPITNETSEKNDADGKTYKTQYFERARFEHHPENKDPKFQVLLGLLGKEALAAKYGNKPPSAPKQVVPGSGSRLFSETGKTVTGLFLDYWENNGGLAQQGFPITEAYNEKNDADGKTYITQYFERARFEYHPENADPKYKVLLGLVGKEINSRKQGTGGTNTDPTNTDPKWSSLALKPPFDAVTVWPSDSGSRFAGNAMFFKDGAFQLYDIKNDTAGMAAPIAGLNPFTPFWPGLPVFNKVDAVAVWTPGDKLYPGALFFSGASSSLFLHAGDIAAGAGRVADPTHPNGIRIVPAQPADPKAFIPGFPFTGVDAAAVWPKNSPYPNKAFFFKGKEYVRYDGITHKMDDGYPLPLSVWPGLPFDGDLDAVVVWPNGKAYFFKGNEYARYDIATDKTDPGYPKPIR